MYIKPFVTMPKQSQIQSPVHTPEFYKHNGKQRVERRGNKDPNSGGGRARTSRKFSLLGVISRGQRQRERSGPSERAAEKERRAGREMGKQRARQTKGPSARDRQTGMQGRGSAEALVGMAQLHTARRAVRLPLSLKVSAGMCRAGSRGLFACRA